MENVENRSEGAKGLRSQVFRALEQNIIGQFPNVVFLSH